MKGRSIQGAMWAGLAYFAVVFATGFALGTLRVLVMRPALGEILAVTLELPFILAVSWLASRWLVSRFEVEATFASRLVMGGLAFALLMTAEVLLATLGFGRTLQEHLHHYREVPALLGLAGQLAFAAFPVIQLMTSRS